MTRQVYAQDEMKIMERRTSTKLGKATRFVSSHVGPAAGWVLSALIFAVGTMASTPSMDDLVEVSGTVRSAVDVAGGRTQRGEVIFTVANRSDRYWTAALNEMPARNRLKNISGSFVQTYVEKTPPLRKTYGAAQKAWGLVIDGETVESVNSALDTDRARKSVLMPLLAFIVAAASLLGYLRQIGNQGNRVMATRPTG
jgi:hypothetical protein